MNIKKLFLVFTLGIVPCYTVESSQLNVDDKIDNEKKVSLAGSSYDSDDSTNKSTKTFKTKLFLNQPTQTHTAVRMYSCRQKIKNDQGTLVLCVKRFNDRNNRGRHERIHSSEKHYPCCIGKCSQKFSDSINRGRHQKTHTADPVCKKTFTQLGKAKNHKGEIHNEDRNAQVLNKNQIPLNNLTVQKQIPINPAGKSKKNPSQTTTLQKEIESLRELFKNQEKALKQKKHDIITLKELTTNQSSLIAYLQSTTDKDE